MACSCPDSTYDMTLSDLSTACVYGGCTWGSNNYSKILKATKNKTCTKNGSSSTSTCTVDAGCCA
ncbi:hypothetical protein ACFFSY_00480 [Paenibacillus aurantiacus]|uniref:Lantibiotic n=1 Tax=Paenibacillus aurantiacus TaxID=1936118 RepID=A0ABV5KGR4_9BACL